MSRRALESVTVGEVLPALSVRLRRADLIRYAGASGDFNVIHWNDRVAQSVGLPGVIAHGMLTMAQTVRVVTDWAGDPGAVVDYKVRFTRPVPVPDDDEGAEIVLGGTVTDISAEGDVSVALTATFQGDKILAAAKAVVRLASASPTP
jgi:acyl dehydratase